ncbi:L-threonylcarbamoyladenylate synthase [Chloroflexota bacterium]
MNPITKDYKAAIYLLKNGGVVALPTDTAYCLAADINIESAVKKVFEIKKRPLDKALPVFLPDKEALTSVATDIPDIAWRLTDGFWPGGLTLILKKHLSLLTSALSGGNTVAVRVPNHEIPLDIITSIGSPITGTSANISGQDSPVTADEVYRQLGDKIDMIVDGGKCPIAKLSTIIDLTDNIPRILRVGAIAKEQIEKTCGIVLKYS